MTLLKGRRRRDTRRPLAVSNELAGAPVRPRPEPASSSSTGPQSPQRVLDRNDNNDNDYDMDDISTASNSTTTGSNANIRVYNVHDQNQDPRFIHESSSYSLSLASDRSPVDLEESTRMLDIAETGAETETSAGASRPRSLKAVKRYSGALNLDEASMGSPLETRFNSPLHKNKSPSVNINATRQSQEPRNRFRHHRTNSSLGMSDEPTSSAGSLKRPLPFSQLLENMPSSSKPFSSSGNSGSSPRMEVRRRDSIETLFSDSPSKPEFAVPTRTSSPSPNMSSNSLVGGGSSNMRPQHYHQHLKPKHHETSTPNYKQVKPLQTAFLSSGLMSKRNRMNSDDSSELSSFLSNHSLQQHPNINPNDSMIKMSTPMAAPPSSSSFSASAAASPMFQNLSFGSSSNYMHFSDLSRNTRVIPDTPVKRPTQPPTPLTGNVPGVFGLSRKNRGLRDSLLKFSVDFGNANAANANANTSESSPLDILDAPPMLGTVASRQSSNASTITSLDTPSHNHHSRTTFFDQTPSHMSSSNMSSHVTDFMDSPRTPTLDITMHTDVDLFNTSSGFNSTSGGGGATENGNGNGGKEPPRTPAKGHLLIGTKQQEGLDLSLTEKFDKVQLIGRGEFSIVYGVLVHNQGGATETRYAVKRTKYPYMGPKTRSRKLEEVQILRQLTMDSSSLVDLLGEDDVSKNGGGGSESDGDTKDQQVEEQGREHIVHMLDAWENNNHLYIMAEFCDNGNLDTFLSERGNVSRLDEWRVWKILVEISLGLRYIHQQGFLHLDLKPANVFITFEGILKIGDFGMATKFPAPPGTEREGDREYIAPEVLTQQQYGTPADVFSLGMMMLEIAANIVLPDNGIHWQKLRSGDLSEAGRLSSGDLTMADESMLSDHSSFDDEDDDEFDVDDAATSSTTATTSGSSSSAKSSCGLDPMSPEARMVSTLKPTRLSSGANTSGSNRSRGGSGRHHRIPSWAPAFMVSDSGALDNIVKWMLQPDPTARPSAGQLLECPEIQWVESHRKAGAVIYEGDYGPEPEPDHGEEETLFKEEWQSRI